MTPEEACYKAYNLGKRIPKLELFISQDAYYSYCYATSVIKGRFILAEPTISKDAYWSYLYALHVIKGKLPDFMHNQMILNNNEYTKNYIKFIK